MHQAIEAGLGMEQVSLIKGYQEGDNIFKSIAWMQIFNWSPDKKMLSNRIHHSSNNLIISWSNAKFLQGCDLGEGVLIVVLV